jgi:hypothetical protein
VKLYGFEEDDPIDYANKSVELYSSKSEWNNISGTNEEVLKDNYDYTAFAKAFLDRVVSINNQDLSIESNEDFFNKMLNYHSNNKYKYLSKWIEMKNQLSKS